MYATLETSNGLLDCIFFCYSGIFVISFQLSFQRQYSLLSSGGRGDFEENSRSGDGVARCVMCMCVSVWVGWYSSCVRVCMNLHTCQSIIAAARLPVRYAGENQQYNIMQWCYTLKQFHSVESFTTHSSALSSATG